LREPSDRSSSAALWRKASEAMTRLAVMSIMSVTFTTTGALAQGYRPTPEITTDRVQHAILEVRLAEKGSQRGLLRAPVERTNQDIFLHDTPLVTNVDVLAARAVETNGHFNVVVTLTETGAGAMARGTAGQQGKLLAIILDGTVIAAPTITGVMGERLVIDRAYSRAQAERIAASLSRQ
jgi:preprotein translocase subunit SecD